MKTSATNLLPSKERYRVFSTQTSTLDSFSASINDTYSLTLAYPSIRFVWNIYVCPINQHLLSMMKFHMFGLIFNQSKVIYSVIELIMVYMMNFLFPAKLSSKMLLHHNPMLKRSFTIMMDSFISIISNRTVPLWFMGYGFYTLCLYRYSIVVVAKFSTSDWFIAFNTRHTNSMILGGI